MDLEVRGIVGEIKEKVREETVNKGEIKNILRRSGVAAEISKVAGGAGLAFTAFLVGKHIANGNVEGLGYDALNLWVMPKIGEKISGAMLQLGEKLDSQMLKGFAPVIGRSIGNFAAFLGLVESIKARQNAKSPADIKIADLNIATNSIFIAAGVPAIATEIMSTAGIEVGAAGEFAGPVGAAVGVAVIIIAQFVEAGLEVEKLEEHIKLTDKEKHDLYWDFFLSKKIPDYIERDIEAKEIYEQYISKIIDSLKDKYDAIAISLPEIFVIEKKYARVHYTPGLPLPPVCSPEIVCIPSPGASPPIRSCSIKKEIANIQFGFGLNINVNLANIVDSTRLCGQNFREAIQEPRQNLENP